MAQYVPILDSPYHFQRGKNSCIHACLHMSLVKHDAFVKMDDLTTFPNICNPKLQDDGLTALFLPFVHEPAKKWHLSCNSTQHLSGTSHKI